MFSSNSQAKISHPKSLSFKYQQEMSMNKIIKICLSFICLVMVSSAFSQEGANNFVIPKLIIQYKSNESKTMFPKDPIVYQFIAISQTSSKKEFPLGYVVENNKGEVAATVTNVVYKKFLLLAPFTIKVSVIPNYDYVDSNYNFSSFIWSKIEKFIGSDQDVAIFFSKIPYTDLNTIVFNASEKDWKKDQSTFSQENNYYNMLTQKLFQKQGDF